MVFIRAVSPAAAPDPFRSPYPFAAFRIDDLKSDGLSFIGKGDSGFKVVGQITELIGPQIYFGILGPGDGDGQEYGQQQQEMFFHSDILAD